MENNNVLLNPRRWNREMSDAWHQNIPDLFKAFEALRKCDIEEKKEFLEYKSCYPIDIYNYVLKSLIGGVGHCSSCGNGVVIILKTKQEISTSSTVDELMKQLQ